MSSAERRGRALEEHVLDEVGDAAALVGLVARAARQPHADADRTDVRHGLGDESKAVVENIADNHCEIAEGHGHWRRAGQPAENRIISRDPGPPRYNHSRVRPWNTGDMSARVKHRASAMTLRQTSTGAIRALDDSAAASARPRRAGARRAGAGARGEGRPRVPRRADLPLDPPTGVTDFDRMTDLSRELRAALSEHAVISTPEMARKDVSSDGTTKYLLRAGRRRADRVGVHPRHAGPDLLHLDAGRLRDEVRLLPDRQDGPRPQPHGGRNRRRRCACWRTDLGLLDTPFNIVVMGMGEPLHNYDDDDEGAADARRRSTASPCRRGASRCRRSASCRRSSGWRSEPYMPNLAISLHATTEAQRDELVPINRKYGLAQLLDACRRFPLKKRGRITFEYVLLAGVNDTPEDARRLVRLLTGIKGKVNLLPLNAAPGIPFERPSDERVDRVREDPRRPRHHRVGAQEPRPRHPRGVRTADRRRRA